MEALGQDGRVARTAHGRDLPQWRVARRDLPIRDRSRALIARPPPIPTCTFTGARVDRDPAGVVFRIACPQRRQRDPEERHRARDRDPQRAAGRQSQNRPRNVRHRQLDPVPRPCLSPTPLRRHGLPRPSQHHLYRRPRAPGQEGHVRQRRRPSATELWRSARVPLITTQPGCTSRRRRSR